MQYCNIHYRKLYANLSSRKKSLILLLMKKFIHRLTRHNFTTHLVTIIAIFIYVTKNYIPLCISYLLFYLVLFIFIMLEKAHICFVSTLSNLNFPDDDHRGAVLQELNKNVFMCGLCFVNVWYAALYKYWSVNIIVLVLFYKKNIGKKNWFI